MNGLSDFSSLETAEVVAVLSKSNGSVIVFHKPSTRILYELVCLSLLCSDVGRLM